MVNAIHDSGSDIPVRPIKAANRPNTLWAAIEIGQLQIRPGERSATGGDADQQSAPSAGGWSPSQKLRFGQLNANPRMRRVFLRNFTSAGTIRPAHAKATRIGRRLPLKASS
ncbi:hypothetical protein [Bradyrhizobium sp. AT1]|uniref:hypothetical protein n=1 Tax=Bradyrhizobium sp. AT1 TaxID=574934 RepID=UPI000B0BDC23|nr:hypothetical protein [Bradyrhizobium sp. AT1]